MYAGTAIIGLATMIQRFVVFAEWKQLKKKKMLRNCLKKLKRCWGENDNYAVVSL